MKILNFFGEIKFIKMKAKTKKKRKIVKKQKSQSNFSKLASITTNTLGNAYLKYKEFRKEKNKRN